MIRELKFKKAFAKTVARFEAWWNQEIIDRPPVSLGVKTSRPYAGPGPKKYDSFRDQWFDVEYRVDCAVADMDRRDYVGDAFPSFNPNMGPEVTATVFGVELEYTQTTSWAVPIVKSAAQWREIITAKPDYGNPYWRAVERLMDYAIEICDGRYVVGITDLHGNYDILAALREPQELCLDLVDCPEVLDQACAKATECFIELFNRSWRKVAAAGFGSTTWCSCYHEGPMYIPSCDFWCMMSTQMGRERVWPFTLKEMQPLDCSHYHLDGPDALRYLDLLLECPQLNSVQWVFGSGHGPAMKWLDVYKRIQAAGKSMEIPCSGPKEAMDFLEQLRPEGLWLHAGGFDSIESANNFLKDVEKLAARRRKSP